MALPDYSVLLTFKSKISEQSLTTLFKFFLGLSKSLQAIIIWGSFSITFFFNSSHQNMPFTHAAKSCPKKVMVPKLNFPAAEDEKQRRYTRRKTGRVYKGRKWANKDVG